MGQPSDGELNPMSNSIVTKICSLFRLIKICLGKLLIHEWALNPQSQPAAVDQIWKELCRIEPITSKVLSY